MNYEDTTSKPSNHSKNTHKKPAVKYRVFVFLENTCEKE